jgi:glycosyltransferase involved in cell wall biosynthesis
MVCRYPSGQSHHVLILNDPGEMSPEFEATGAAVSHLKIMQDPWPRFCSRLQKVAESIRPRGIIFWHGLVHLPQMLRALEPLQVPWAVHGGNPAHNMPRWVDLKFRLLGCLFPVQRLPTYACCSQFVEESFQSSTFLRRFPRVVIPNGVEPPPVEHKPKEIDRKDPCTIGMLARLDSIKDHRTLLEAFKIVLRTRPSAVLELAGDGDLRAALEEFADANAIRQQVRFLGTVVDIYPVMARWDVFAYATTEQEGFGNALVEAMMLGLPCVATDVGPVAEVAGTPPQIALVPPNDPTALAERILVLLQTPSERWSLGEAARLRANVEFSAAVFAKRYVDLLTGSQPVSTAA